MAAARSLGKGPNQGGTRRQAGDYGRRDPARLEGLRRQGRAADAPLLAHEAAKQALRDIPNGQDGTDAQCDAATTPADQHAIWPAALSFTRTARPHAAAWDMGRGGGFGAD